MNKNPKNGREFQWNGEKVKDVKFGYVVQEPNEKQPMYWYNWEVAKQFENGISSGKFATIPAVQITTQTGKPFCIANIAGMGVRKMENGGMWYSQPGHFSLDGNFTEYEELAIYEYNHLDYVVYQAGLDKWQKENYPEDYAKLEAIKNAYQKPAIKEFKPGAVIDGNSLMAAQKHGKSNVIGKTKYHGKNKKR